MKSLRIMKSTFLTILFSTQSWALDITCTVSGGIFATQSHFPGDRVRNNIQPIEPSNIHFVINQSNQRCAWGKSVLTLWEDSDSTIGCTFSKVSGSGKYGDFKYATKTIEERISLNRLSGVGEAIRHTKHESEDEHFTEIFIQYKLTDCQKSRAKF